MTNLEIMELALKRINNPNYDYEQALILLFAAELTQSITTHEQTYEH